MPKFKVHVCRVGYSHLDIEVEANNPADAEQKALDDAGNHSFPGENHSEYSAEGVTNLG